MTAWFKDCRRYQKGANDRPLLSLSLRDVWFGGGGGPYQEHGVDGLF